MVKFSMIQKVAEMNLSELLLMRIRRKRMRMTMKMNIWMAVWMTMRMTMRMTIWMTIWMTFEDADYVCTGNNGRTDGALGRGTALENLANITSSSSGMLWSAVARTSTIMKSTAK